MIAANVALIAVLQAIRLRWLQLNSGFNCLSKLSLICAPIPSPCTSRNLNLNPFCKLTDNTSLAKWKPAIHATYANVSETPNYIRELPGPMRLVYAGGMAERELITSLAQVFIIHINSEKYQISLFLSQEEYYNAFEKDIAVVNIFLGKPTVFGKFLFSRLYATSLMLN